MVQRAVPGEPQGKKTARSCWVLREDPQTLSELKLVRGRSRSERAAWFTF
jgi:hypothetical protein